MQPVSVQPQQLRNMQGHLRFAMEATKAEDAPGPSVVRSMDEERRKYLEEALKDLTVDVVEVFENAIRVLSDSEKIKGIQLGQPLPDDVTLAVHDLIDYLDDFDISNDFYKLGGFAIFPLCYGSENEDVRDLAGKVLQAVCQDNRYCQAKALECGLLNVLLNLAGRESGVPLLKTLFALLSAIHGYEPSYKELVAQDGCGTLARLLQHGVVRSTAATIIRDLCENHADAKAQFVEMNLVHMIAEQLKKERFDSQAPFLGLLVAMTQGTLDPEVLQQCRNPSLHLKTSLQLILNDPAVTDYGFVKKRTECRRLLGLLGSQSERFPDDGPDR